MSTINATLSAKAINSSYTGSEDHQAHKFSDTEETSSIAYLRVKNSALATCVSRLNDTIEIVKNKFKVDIKITLVKDGKYNGYFKIITDSDEAMEFSKSLLLESETDKD